MTHISQAGSLAEIAEALGHPPTVRLYAGDVRWCALDPDKAEDVEAFCAYLTRSQGSTRDRAL